MIRLYNSLTNKVEEFKPIREGFVSMYVCGPTVYSYLHIGNSRPVIFFDVVSRFFKYLGYKVTYVSNFTDIDDKIIKASKKEGITEKELSEKFIEQARDLYHKLNCLPHDANPKVTETMNEIISFIEKMVELGGAYVTDGDVYFDVAKIKEYGILSGQNVDSLINGARVEVSDKKHNVIDFTLWKETTEGVNWPSPWSEGRPGWHTECVVMIDKIFSGMIDIHGGGNDLKFPHHDNEIAQSICVHNNKIANYWMHNGRVDLAGEKMSKSLGNVIWAYELLSKTNYESYRMMMLNVPYRQILNYSESLLKQAETDFEKIRRVYITSFRKLELAKSDLSFLDTATSKWESKYDDVNLIKDEFINHLANDFNTPNGISTIFKLAKVMNNVIRAKDIDLVYLSDLLRALHDMLWVLGIDFTLLRLTDNDITLINKWNDAKVNKDFELADKLREEIVSRNILL